MEEQFVLPVLHTLEAVAPLKSICNPHDVMLRRNIDLLKPTSLSLILAGMLIGAFIGPPSLTGFIYAQAPAADNRPNFLLIMGDDFGYSDIGAFGSEISTPNLDALAKDGKVLTNYHTAPTCSPARVAFLTGVDWHIGGIGTMYELIAPNQVGKPGYETYINDKVVTVAELLRDAGYNTMQSGKWHLSGRGYQPGTSPYDRGFSNALTLLEDGANHFTDQPYVPGWSVTFTANATVTPRPENGTFEAKMYTDQLLGFFKKTESEKKPFFAYLAFQVAHSPFQAPPELIDKYDRIYSVGWDKIREQRFERQKELGFWPSNMTDPGRLPPNQAWESLTDDQKAYAARVLAVHAAMIEEMDKNIGRVIQYLKDTGKYDNTFISFTSDNGSSEPFEASDFRYGSSVDLTHANQFVARINNSLSNLGNPNSDFNYGAWGSYVAVAPFSGFKTSFYEGGTRPPLVIKPPQSSSSSSSSSSTATTTGNNLIKSFVYVTDITPTVLDLTGVSHPSTYKGHEVHPLKGKSLNPLLEGTVKVIHPREEAVAGEMFNNTSMRMGDWKATSYGFPPQWKLYNLATDLGENVDLAQKHPEILQKLVSAYNKYAHDVGVVIPRGEKFEQISKNIFPPVTQRDIQTINLAKMFAPGYSLNETKSGAAVPNQ
jgi:arylsulfatase A-like enzyme